MTMTNYIDFACSFGYQIRFTDLGIAEIMIKDLTLKTDMTVKEAQSELAMIGMAIMNDTLRAACPVEEEV